MDNDHLSRSILAFNFKSYSVKVLSWLKLLLIAISWYLDSDIRIFGAILLIRADLDISHFNHVQFWALETGMYTVRR